MINDEYTTDTNLNTRPVEKVIRDELAKRIHEMQHGPEHRFDDPTCWAAWEPEADALMPIVIKWLSLAWEEGSRDGARGVLPDATRVRRNPYRGGWRP